MAKTWTEIEDLAVAHIINTQEIIPVEISIEIIVDRQVHGDPRIDTGITTDVVTMTKGTTETDRGIDQEIGHGIDQGIDHGIDRETDLGHEKKNIKEVVENQMMMIIDHRANRINDLKNLLAKTETVKSENRQQLKVYRPINLISAVS